MDWFPVCWFWCAQNRNWRGWLVTCWKFVRRNLAECLVDLASIFAQFRFPEEDDTCPTQNEMVERFWFEVGYSLMSNKLVLELYSRLYFIYTHIYVYGQIYTITVYIYTYVYARLDIHIYIHINIHISIYIYTYIYIYIYIYIFTYIYIYVFTYT